METPTELVKGTGTKMDFDATKFKELLLYVAERSGDDPSFGRTKLNKILFFSDFLSYGNTGKPITGATYQRLDRGPAPRELLAAESQLQAEDSAIVVERDYFGLRQKRLFAKRPPDLSLFTPEEISLVEGVIEVLRHDNASEVSRLSHMISVGWQLAGDREDIPYEAVFLSPDQPTANDIKRGEELAAEHGWRT